MHIRLLLFVRKIAIKCNEEFAEKGSRSSSLESKESVSSVIGYDSPIAIFLLRKDHFS